MNFEFDTPYGNNESVGNYCINGAKSTMRNMEKVLLLIHGNGGSIIDGKSD
jgi:hypothetical protein